MINAELHGDANRSRRGRNRSLIIGFIEILASLPGVTNHVIEAERIGL
jgi:hypothetical protein